ncbi:MAG: glycosyltransferase family 2 protein [Armatimonadetes bacterium]|nr:glycosyltransferase family 2 protein [Armatimonadota bacterium]
MAPSQREPAVSGEAVADPGAPSRAIRLSAVMIAQDEADRIGAALASLQFADEIVVVDGGSRDATAAIAVQAGARVFHNPWPGYGRQVRFAVAQARGEWVFRLDADEVAPTELQAEILEVVAQADRAEVGYRMGHVTMMYGRPLRFCVRQSAKSYRLWRRDSADVAVWEVHENPVFHDRQPVIGRLRSRFLHYPWRDLTHMVSKLARYGQLKALEAFRAGRRRRWPAFAMATAFPAKFLEVFLLRRGFLDGWRGLIYAVACGTGAFVKEATFGLYQSGLVEPPSLPQESAPGSGAAETGGGQGARD